MLQCIITHECNMVQCSAVSAVTFLLPLVLGLSPQPAFNTANTANHCHSKYADRLALKYLLLYLFVAFDRQLLQTDNEIYKLRSIRICLKEW